MDYSKIIFQAHLYAKDLSKMVSGIAIFGIGFDHFVVGLPNWIVTPMYIPLIGTAISLLADALKVAANPRTVPGKKCLKCGWDMVFTGLKCPNPDCGYVMDF